MLRTDLTDHRGTDDARLVRAVAEGDAIALAEAYHRTITAAHACARRLLASPVEIEALLRSVYSELWQEPPVDEALEGWVRARCFALGTGYLRQRNLRAPSPSLVEWSSGIEADQHGAGDPLEQMIAELTPEQQAALVRAHDQGVRTSEQEDAGAGDALLHALLMLASPLTDDERHAAEMCSSGVSLANWMFGLLPPHEAATVPGTAAEPTPCGRLANVLRRARRRFEPLPPTPDLGHRVLAWVLGSGQTRESHETRASRLDSDLRIASADLDRGWRGQDQPRSSLDMTVPMAPPTEAEQQPLSASQRETGIAAGDAPSDDDAALGGDTGPTPLRAAPGPPALSGAATPPPAFGNTAPALTPEPTRPDDDAGEQLVRMPLPRVARRKLARAGERDTTEASAADSATTVPPRGPASDDATAPPALRREAASDADRSDLRQTVESPLARGPGGRPAPAPSPLTGSERSRSAADQDTDAESPLRRPAPTGGPAPAGAQPDTQPPPLSARVDPGKRAEQPSTQDPDATARTPIQRDDSDPRINDLFGTGADTGAGVEAADPTASMTAPTLPPARRPPLSAPGRQPAPTGRQPGQSQTAVAGLATTESEPTANSVLRWLVVVLLIAAGAAVGIMLGQALI